MSSSESGPGTREVAYRLFASEFDDATVSYSESDEERAPNYVLTPLGARVNRLFVTGVLTEVERVNEETRRGRIVDPSGAFVTYAGQYQPDEQAFLERADPPTFVALTGKARTFQPEDSDRVFTSVRPESLAEVDAETRDRWVVRAAETTLDRLAVFQAALASDCHGEDLRAALEAGGASAPLAEGIPRAIDHYGTTEAYLEATRRMAIDALELIAGDRDDVRVPDIAPDDGGPTEIGPLPETDISIDVSAVSEPDADDAVAGTAGTADTADTAGTADTADTAGTAGTADTVDTTDTAGTADTTDTVDTTDTADTAGTTDTAADDIEEPDTTAAASTATTADSDDPDEQLGAFDADATGETDADPDPGGDASGTTQTGDTSDVDPTDTDEMYQLDEEERAEIEDEFGTDFSTGTEVDDPGSADIDVPSADDLSAPDDPSSDSAAAADDAEDPEAEIDLGEPVGSNGADHTTADTAPDATADTAPDTTADTTPDATADTAPDTTDGDAAIDAGPAADAGTTTDAGSAVDDGSAASADASDLDLTGAAIDAMDDLDDGDGAPREDVVEAVVEALGADPDAVDDAIDDALMSGKCYEPSDDRLKAI